MTSPRIHEFLCRLGVHFWSIRTPAYLCGHPQVDAKPNGDYRCCGVCRRMEFRANNVPA